MATLYITDANTGQLIEIDTENPSGSIYVVDADSGELVLLDLSSPAGTLNVVDADTGDIFHIDYSNLTGTLHVVDANTGDLVEIDLSNPEFSIYVNDENTGDLVLLTRSGGPPPDTTAPTVAISLSQYSFVDGDTATITFTFSEEVMNFTVDDVTAPNGALSSFTVTANPLIYTAIFTPTNDVVDFTNVITVGTNWTDLNGNPPTSSTTSDNYEVTTVELYTVSPAGNYESFDGKYRFNTVSLSIDWLNIQIYDADDNVILGNWYNNTEFLESPARHYTMEITTVAELLLPGSFKWKVLGYASGPNHTTPYTPLVEYSITPQYETPSYANVDGTGDRTASIQVSTDLGIGLGPINKLVNGDTTTSDLYTSGGDVTGKYILFDFVQARLITEAKFYTNTGPSFGTWKWQGSNNNSTWADIGSSFAMGNAIVQTQTELSGNTEGYRYYRLLGVSGTVADEFMKEFEFKIGNIVP